MIFISEAQPISARLDLQVPPLRASVDEARRGSPGAMPKMPPVELGYVGEREGRGMTLTPVESSHIAAIAYDPETEILEVQFRNGDCWSYAYVHQDLFDHFVSASSIGSFFTSRIQPASPGTLISKGTLAERAEIWLRSKNTKRNYAGQWVALAMGSPVTVIGYAETEEQARAAAGEGGGEFVVVQVPGRIEANRYDV